MIVFCFKFSVTINFKFSTFIPKLKTSFMYTIKYLEQFTKQVFEKMGCSPEDAQTASNVFVAAELRGLPSHGMIRI